MQRVLLDTGAFLGYLFPKEYQREVISQQLKGVELLVPYQVLREAYATLTRSPQNRGGLGMRPMTVVQIFRKVMESGVFRFVSENEAILQRWLNFVEKAGITSADTFDEYMVDTGQTYDVIPKRHISLSFEGVRRRLRRRRTPQITHACQRFILTTSEGQKAKHM